MQGIGTGSLVCVAVCQLPVGSPPPAFDAPPLLVDDEVGLHTGQALIDGQLFATVDATAAAAEDLDDDARAGDVHLVVAELGAELAVARHHGVGVVVAGRLALALAQAHP